MKLFRLACGLFFLCLSANASAVSYSGLYVFGNSLSDSGNMINTLRAYGANPDPDGVYYDGRSSNGPNYVDLLAAELGLDSTPSTAGGTNYAYNAARMTYHPLGTGFYGVDEQIQLYLGSNGGSADADGLYLVWGGTNDLLDLAIGLGNGTVDPADLPALLIGIANDLTNQIAILANAGAQNIVVFNEPSLALLPEAQIYSALLPLLDVLTQSFNSALDVMLNDLSGPTFYRIDIYSLFADMATNPQNYGLTNTTDACYTGDYKELVGGGSVCASPDEYLFWDGIHPSAAAHVYIAEAVLAQVAIPEPAPLGLLFTGLAILGLRRRQIGKKACISSRVSQPAVLLSASAPLPA